MSSLAPTKKIARNATKTQVAIGFSILIFLTVVLQSAYCQTVKIQHIVFDDALRNDWTDGSVKCKTDPKYDQWILNGSYALSATLEKGGNLIFERQIPFSIRNYTGIAGYINGGSSGKQIIGICVIDHTGARKPNDIGLDIRKYTQGGMLPIDDWKLFAIPFSEFGPLPKGIKGICFVNAGDANADPFFLDDFGIVDFTIKTGKPATIVKPVQTKPKEFVYIYTDKFENEWQDWSWDCQVTPYPESCASGKASLFAGQSVNGAFAFAAPKSFLTKDFDSLIFSINGGPKSDKQVLRVALFDNEGKEIRRSSVNLNNPKYIEDGSLSMNTWKKVKIPFSDMRGDNTPVKKIAIINSSTEAQAFLIDDVMLVK